MDFRIDYRQSLKGLYRLTGAVLFCCACLGALTSQTARAQSVEPALVISQVYGGGGNSGADYTHDFVELFNPGPEPVALAGWSIQYASATGTNWQMTELTGTIAPGGYFLIQQAQGNRGSLPLPSPDAVGTIPLSAGQGKVALLATARLLPKGTRCPAGPELIDLVGFGDTDCFAGSGPGPTLDSRSAALRGDGGCRISGENAADFMAAPPTPRNRTTAPRPCPVKAGPPNPSPIGSREPITPTALAGRFVLSPTTEAPAIRAAGAISPTNRPLLLISQIYGGGGNSGADYTHDFVELFNPGPEPAALDGWSVQYASASGKNWLVTPLSGTVAPGSYFLVQQAQGAGGRLGLPAPDVTGDTALSAGSGKVALVQSAAALTGPCPAGEAIVDFVGYGSADCFEGSGPAPKGGNAVALLRQPGPPQDSDDNRADFAPSPPAPRRER